MANMNDWKSALKADPTVVADEIARGIVSEREAEGGDGA